MHASLSHIHSPFNSHALLSLLLPLTIQFLLLSVRLQKVMTVCIECRKPVRRLINPDTRTVERCPHCDRSCDTYLEFSPIQLWIDVALLQSGAWLHILFNELWYIPTCLLLWLMCCLLDAVVAFCTTDSPDASVAMAMHCNESGSIQVVSMTQNTDVQSVIVLISETLPRFFFFAVGEMSLLMSVSVWMGSRFRPAGSDYTRVLKSWARAVVIAEHTKLLYIPFFVWVMPSRLLVVVDAVFFIFLLRGFQLLTTGQPRYCALLGLSACLCARFAYRHFTQWNSQLTCV